MTKLLLFVVLLIPSITYAASFDCNKAHSDVEKLICNTPELSKADDELYVDYLQAKLVTGNSDEFKKLAKKNWDLRTKNCDTKQCLLDWYKRSTVIYRNVAASHPIEEQDVSGTTYYYGSSVKIKGTLTRESKASGGYPSIRTDDVISVSSRTPDEAESDEPGEWGVAVMQLAMTDKSQWRYFENNINSKAWVTCNLYHAHTGHHYTPVMCLVENIDPAK